MEVIMKKTISMFLVFIMVVSVLLTGNVQVTLASNKYITVNEFIVSLLKELNLEVKSNKNNIKQLQ